VEGLTGEARAGKDAAATAVDASAGAAARGSGKRALVFVGFMGAGKSSAARAAAAELGVPAVDADRELEREVGEPLEAYFDREGEAAFRRREEQVVTRLLDRPDAEVVALGGGALGSEAVRDRLRRHLVVHLDVDVDDAWRRASGRGRPLARDRVRFGELLAERRAVYESAADASLPPGGRDLVHRALPALVELRDRAPTGTTMLWSSTASGEHPVFLGRGLLGSGFFHPRGRRFVVTDTTVSEAQPDALAGLSDAGSAAIPPGETEKTLGRVGEVLGRMARAGVTRDDLLVALGGGVVGDLGGFCAAIYQRGMGWVAVPTTLLAQVDSAYGGKTGVDLPEAKNYAGAYHQPASVLVDPATLDTLPDAERAAGWAEVVKTALIAGGELWRRVRSGVVDDQVIVGCARTKLAVVAQDERDTGRRQVLNLGHTVGHAIEAATGYSRVRHGEAVGLGLLAALRLSRRESLRSEVAELLRARGLPETVEGLAPDAVVELVARDKKRTAAGVGFVLVEAPGAVTPGHQVPDEDLRAAVEEICSS
jgi:shikimate kinase/3-dehydroquinate synthase